MAASSPVLTIDDGPEDSEHGIAWVRVAVDRFSTLVPSQKDGWRIIGINTSDGQASAPSLVRLSNVDGTSLITLNPRNGDMYWYLLRDGFFYEVQMRIEQDNGGVLVVDRAEMTRLYGSLADIPLYVLDHIELAPEPTATPEPTETPEPTPTSAIAP